MRLAHASSRPFPRVYFRQIRDDQGMHTRDRLKYVKISSGCWLMLIVEVERDPPLSKNVSTTLCPNICRQGAECLPSWAYNRSADFLATSMYNFFMAFIVFRIFISPTTLTSLQSSGLDLSFATSTGTKTRSGFRLASDPFRGVLAPSATHFLNEYVNTSCERYAIK